MSAFLLAAATPTVVITALWVAFLPHLRQAWTRHAIAARCWWLHRGHLTVGARYPAGPLWLEPFDCGRCDGRTRTRVVGHIDTAG